MPILHHEFIYACFHPHPQMEDCVIALEKNYYPRGSELYQLVGDGTSYYDIIKKQLEGLNDPDKIRKIAQLAGLEKDLLTIVTEEDMNTNNNAGNNSFVKEGSLMDVADNSFNNKVQLSQRPITDEDIQLEAKNL